MDQNYYQCLLKANYDKGFNIINEFADNTGQKIAANKKSGFFMFNTSQKFMPKNCAFFRILVKKENDDYLRMLFHINSNCGSSIKNSEMIEKHFNSFKDYLENQFVDPITFENIEFNATQEVSGYLEIDQAKNLALIYSSDLIGFPFIFQFTNLISYELQEDGEIVTSGGLVRAVVGAMTFGAVGAIVGATTGKKKNKNICNSLQIKLTINDPSNPNMFTQYINFLISPEQKTSIEFKKAYSTAQECCSLLEIVLNEKNNAVIENKGTDSDIDDLKKYHELLESGIITQEDYDLKKRQILQI